MSTTTNHPQATSGRGTARHDAVDPSAATAVRQFSLRQILVTWAMAALPMGALAWLVAPWIAHGLDGPTALPRALIATLTAGLVWQFLLVLILVYREQRSLRWRVLRDALWLRAPRSPRTGRRGGRAWLILLPLVLALAAEELLPTLPTPAGRDMGLFLGSDAGQSFLSGNWGWFAVIIALQVFNTVLGEELLFRGLLLPRMNGAFGRWDWAANGILFAAYHLHVPWVIPQTLVDTVVPFAAKRGNSALVGIAVHSVQSLFFASLALAVVLK
jgi:membrane protease YdiL (CAAX protease family)